MNDLNMANRSCCDLDIREYGTNKPFLFADFCNTTTAGFQSDNTYATIKGEKAITFSNPLEGTMTLEFQCHPFKIYSLLSDGTIDTTAILPRRKTVTCTTDGQLEINGETPIKGTVFVYEEDDFGGTEIEGTVNITTDAGSEQILFTANDESKVVAGSKYLVCYLVEKTTGVKSVAFNNDKIPKDYRITMETIDIDEEKQAIPIKITAYKASIQRNLDLSFSSTGDPASITLTFDCLRDEEGRVLEIVEETDEE